MGTWNTYWSGVAPNGAGQWYMNPQTQMWSYGTPPPGAMTQQQFQQQTSAGTYTPPPNPADVAPPQAAPPSKFFDDSGYEWDSSSGRGVRTGVYDPNQNKSLSPIQPNTGVPVANTNGFMTGEYMDAQAQAQAAQAQLLSAGRGQGIVGDRGGVPTDSRGAGLGAVALDPPPPPSFSPGTTRIPPPVTQPAPAPGGGNPASTQPPPGIQTPPAPTPGGGGTAPGRGFGFDPAPGGGPPSPIQPPNGGPPASQGGGANPAAGYPGVPRWDAAFAGANPFTSSGVTGGTGGTGYTPAGAPGATQSPFSTTSSGNQAMGQMLAGGTPQGSPADAWMSQLAQGSTDALKGFAQGTNPFMQALLSGNTPNSDALKSIVAGGGNPIDQMPAWDAMVKAQQRNIDTGQARLNAQFDVSGNRFSNAFGTASTDYQNQSILDQNALLAQMTAQAGEGAQGRLLNAGTALAGFGQQGLTTGAGIGAGAAQGLAGLGAQAAGQLSGQDFQSIMQQYGISADMAKYMAGGADTAASQLAGLGAAGSNAIYGGSMAGANALFGGENQAAQSMYGAQNSTLPAFMNYLMGSQQQGLGAASDLSQLWNANLQTGAGIGQQQYTDQQSAINNAYQEWLRTQPTNNPLLSMMFSGATGYPQMYNPSYQPGILGSLLGTVGQIGGAIAGRQ